MKSRMIHCVGFDICQKSIEVIGDSGGPHYCGTKKEGDIFVPVCNGATGKKKK